MSRRRWRPRGTVISALACTLAISGAAPGLADSPAPTVGTAPTSDQAGGATGPYQVTLLTGDVVQYSKDANGTPRVTVQPDARAERGGLSFLSVPEGNSFYVYPSDAMPLVQSGKLDRGLFDVAYLAQNGYTDDLTASLPVIAQYGSAVARTSSTLDARAEALPGNGAATPLPSVRGAGFDVAKTQAGRFWKTVTGARANPTALGGGLSKLWLDRVVTPTLDRSVPQIGAPEAWKSGLDGTGVRVAVLDTGLDMDHPDFAGRVEQLVNFTPDATANDGFGHGTHVASIIAGSGEASGGKYRGVAPGASLLVGKVLRDFGTGSSLDALEGMEWAAAQGADVVNMSLGTGGGSDGTDLFSQAVNDLTAQYGTLFVIAAGNSGPTARTIGSPGTADAALTVAAVDRNDRIAPFSSRGPRFGDYGLKPDIAAPGVGIVAARSDPSIMAGAVGEQYVAVSGTSMATPHVAGAAAILAQQHPDWTAGTLKPVLVSTAKDAGNRTYEQGAGRVDVARATTQKVYAANNLDFGKFAYPQTGPAQRVVTYVNDSDTPVTLSLKTVLAGNDGKAAPKGMLSLDRPTVTVPAKGTAQVTATVDPTVKAEKTWYEGAVRATAAGVEVGTAVGFYVEPQSFDVTGKVILADGMENPFLGALTFTRNDGRSDRGEAQFGEIAEGQTEGTVRLYGGSHSVAMQVQWFDSDGLNSAMAIEPEFEVTGDMTVTLDLRKLEKVTVTTSRGSDDYLEAIGLMRLGKNNFGGVQGVVVARPADGWDAWVTPTRKVKLGSLNMFSQHLLGVRQIRMSVAGRNGPELHPRYQGAETSIVTKFDGRQTFALVDGGSGSAEDLAGVDVRGKLVLLDVSDTCQPILCGGDLTARVSAAAQAGAAGILGYGTQGHVMIGGTDFPAYAVPTVSIPAAEAQMLIGRLARGGVSVDTDGTAVSPYQYSLMFNEVGRIPDDLGYSVDSDDVYQIDDQFHADTDTFVQQTFAGRHDDAVLSVGLNAAPRPARSAVTEYLGPVSDDLLWDRQVQLFRPPPGQGGFLGIFQALDYFPQAGRRTESWGEQPYVAAPPRHTEKLLSSPWVAESCVGCRAGDTIVPASQGMDQAGHAIGQGELTVGLTRDGQAVPLKRRGLLVNALFFLLHFPYDTFDVPAQRDTYTLDYASTPRWPGQLYSAQLADRYTYSSERPEAGESVYTQCLGQNLLGQAVPCGEEQILRLRYGIDLDTANQAVAGRSQEITVNGYYGYTMAAPKLRSLSLQVSFDDGAHWQKVNVSDRNGSFTGRISHPSLERTTGAVSIRAHAVDVNGNTIDQTITRAYGLRAGTRTATAVSE